MTASTSAPAAGRPSVQPPIERHERVAIVGAGLIGRAWAIVFARGGFQVTLHDAVAGVPQQSLAIIAQRLKDLRAVGLLGEEPDTVLRRITPVDDLAEAVRDVVMVQENIREALDAKLDIYAKLDALTPPQAVIASSTSWIPASQFTEALPGRARCLVGHPTNPPYLVPLVELCPAPWTSAQTIERARSLYAQAGQVPVVLTREITGFLLNRIQSAVLDEAMSLYRDGYASATDIDRVLKDGLALRWSFMGPFETIDLNAPGGVTDYATRYGPTYKDVAAQRTPFDWDPAVLERLNAERREMLALDEIESRSAWRDRRLMALIAHKRGQPE